MAERDASFYRVQGQKVRELATKVASDDIAAQLWMVAEQFELLAVYIEGQAAKAGPVNQPASISASLHSMRQI